VTIPANLEDLDAAPKPEIETGSGPETIRALTKAITRGDLPETYVTGGRVVHVEEVSGSVTAAAGDEDSPLPVAASEVKPPGLANLLARHTFCYRVKPGKDGEGKPRPYHEEVTPPPAMLAATLAPKRWPGLKPLHGIAGAPLLRPDGTLLQTPGYDDATGLYLASKIPLRPVPPKPTAKQVTAARNFLFRRFLGDFPWVSDADKANYIGVIATPILRRYLRTLIPFVVYTATMASSGKTILTSGPGMLYGQRVLTWTNDDAELRKTITSVMADPVGTVVFDNLAEGSVIDSPVLARLITDRTWADRLLSKNVTASYANDRLWSATGNNLRLGGDMPSRTVLIRLNPDVPHPEERTGFAIPNLDHWILDPANQRQVLWHLLVLVLDWTGNGAPVKKGVTMRQFTPWAEAVGGFLDHHEIGGFLANVEDVRKADDDDAMWTAFLARWHKIFGGGKWLTARELRQSGTAPERGEKLWDGSVIEANKWDGLFLTDQRGNVPSEVSIGKRLTGHMDRYHGSYVLRSSQDLHTKVRTWQVQEYGSG